MVAWGRGQMKVKWWKGSTWTHGGGKHGISTLQLLYETTIMWLVRGEEGGLGSTNKGRDQFGECGGDIGFACGPGC